MIERDGPAEVPTPNELRAALLSARLFADAHSHPILRPEGPGVMAIHDAVPTLVADGTAPSPTTAWLTRFRLAKALQEAFDPLPPRAEAGADPTSETTASRVAEKLELTVKQDATDTDERNAEIWQAIGGQVEQLGIEAFAQAPASLRAHPNFAAEAGSAAGQERPIDWTTDVAIFPGGATKVTSSIELPTTDIGPLARLCDPSRWADDSLFWFESTVLESGGPGPNPDPTGTPWPWSGRLREVVASTVAVFTADLDVEFHVDDDACLVTYKLAHPIDRLIKDEGYAFVKRLKGGRYRTQLVKWVDFEDAPFGGPSVLDQLLPSYIGSWLRVQQDLWAAKVLGP